MTKQKSAIPKGSTKHLLFTISFSNGKNTWAVDGVMEEKEMHLPVDKLLPRYFECAMSRIQNMYQADRGKSR